MIVSVPIIPSLTSAMQILSAMITPAVLILSCGSLVMTTSTRLMRCIDRVRQMANDLDALESEPKSDTGRRNMVVDQLVKTAARARLLQKALTRLYAGIAFFVGTSVAIGTLALLNAEFAWIPLLLGFVGAGLVLSASVMLIIESRIALALTYEEMDFVLNKHQRI